ncbi:CsgE family curli-type amyloid fiber assembly protein [uncultured Tenacibaculum sp.]|uniref:CsgE family curli-type amyloid fiber assembly protein n=1 Tax=uncultured Tenacibaculum sp. TaxID=174713 RepID=UPI00262E3D44|nr:CsgE family curli-type amyloid fiber assembly protein [uncultured Tenacibaculum sp.]
MNAKVVVLKKDNFLDVKAQAENESVLFKDELNYNLVVLKKSKEESYSSNKQSGQFSLKPNEKKELSLIRLSLNPYEELRVYLFIKHREKLIDKDTLVILPQKVGVTKKEVIDESEFILKGLVIEEAKTKVGKDFYDFFYQEYLLSGLKYPFIIKIKEKPGLRRTTVLIIEADDNKVFEFMTMPGEDFLKQAVKATMARLSTYSKQRNKLLSYKI